MSRRLRQLWTRGSALHQLPYCRSLPALQVTTAADHMAGKDLLATNAGSPAAAAADTAPVGAVTAAAVPIARWVPARPASLIQMFAIATNRWPIVAI